MSYPNQEGSEDGSAGQTVPRAKYIYNKNNNKKVALHLVLVTLAVRGAGDVLRLVQAMVMRKTFPDPIKVYSGTPS